MFLRNSLFKVAFLSAATALGSLPNATSRVGSTTPTYSPARPPSIPLAVRNPYTSTWSTTAGGGTLNSASVRFWTGDPLGWEGIVTVDGISYRYLGVGSQSIPTRPDLLLATPDGVSYDSNYSNFTFTAGPVKITASFFSPVTPKDICRTSVPLSYLTTTAESTDGQPHDLKFYSDVDLSWVSWGISKPAVWELHGAQTTSRFGNATSLSGLYSWIIGQAAPDVFGEDHDMPQWGNFSYSTTQMGAKNFSADAGPLVNIRTEFMETGGLGNSVALNERGRVSNNTVFAYSHDFGTALRTSVRYSIGSVQTPIINYRTRTGISPLRPWWEKCYGDMYSMINFHWEDLDTVRILAYEFESRLRTDIDAYYQDGSTVTSRNMSPVQILPNPGKCRGCLHNEGPGDVPYIFDPSSAYGFLDPTNFSGIAIPGVSETYSHYSITSLSARQAMGAFVYAVPPGSDGLSDEPLVFQKELSSSGNVNTVDVLFPGIPFLLWANPSLLRLALEPILAYQETGLYPNGFAAHDIGAHFPNAVGHDPPDADENMPVEESGNMILMCYASYRFGGADAAWLSRYYDLLRRWATYLVEFSLVPAAQLSTDDFAGTLENQTNLAVKGIVGLQAMSEVAKVVGMAEDAEMFGRTAREYYAQWERLAIDPLGRHTLLAYQWRSSWGLLYNIYPDKLLDLGIVNSSVYKMQCEWYPQVSQIFGVPLDNRHHYTKSDWMMWAAATCPRGTRSLLVNSISYWLNFTTTDDPFTDLFETIGTGYYPTSPTDIRFKARPVVGGHFALLALQRGVMSG